MSFFIQLYYSLITIGQCGNGRTSIILYHRAGKRYFGLSTLISRTQVKDTLKPFKMLDLAINTLPGIRKLL